MREFNISCKEDNEMQALVKHYIDQATNDVARTFGRRLPTAAQREQLMQKETGLVAEALLSHWNFDPVLLSTDIEPGAAVSKGEAAVRRLALWLSSSFVPGDGVEEFEEQEEEGEEDSEDSED